MVQFKDLADGIVIWQTLKNGTRFPLVKIADEQSNMKCSNCGHAVWNAHNLSNSVHICPNRDMQSSEVGTDVTVSITPLKSILHTFK